VTPTSQQQGDFAPVAGILFMLAASAVFVASDSVAKHLSLSFAVVQILWARYTFHLIYLAALTKPRDYRRLITTRAAGLQFVRSASILVSSLCFYVALSYIPLATAAAISFTWPLVVTALSVPLLGERVGIRRWLAVLVGLGGAMIIIRPGFGVFHWSALMPLGTAFFFGLYQICTRKVSRVDSPQTSLLYTAALGALVLNLVVPFHWDPPDTMGWFMMLVLGVCAILGQFLIIKALSLTPAAVLAPYGYVYLVFAGISGFAVFGDIPDAHTIVGSLIITASGLYVYFRERLQARLH
tara:strand:- start:204 stop:1094 length:891 start_codon:yes stop_codon:yes gene_type:complete